MKNGIKLKNKSYQGDYRSQSEAHYPKSMLGFIKAYDDKSKGDDTYAY